MLDHRLFYNCRAHSLAREGERFGGFIVDALGRFAGFMPEGAELPPLRNRVNLGGATVLPAFTDAHTHFLSKTLLGALGPRLCSLEDERPKPDRLEGLLDLIRNAAATRPTGPVVGFGALPAGLEEHRLPTAAELDAALPGREVYIFSLDGHSSAYSTQALRALGLESVAREGILSGEGHEFNMGRVNDRLMRSADARTIARGLHETVAEAAACGIVGVHCLEGFQDATADPTAGIMFALGPGLPLRLTLYLQYTDPGRILKTRKKLRRLRAGGCMAWEMDGSISSRSAAVDRPYLDRGGLGNLYRDPGQAYDLMREFHTRGFQTAAHAIGPRAIESVLGAAERLLDEEGDRENRLRMRIEHFELPRRDQIERAGKRRLVLAMQPGFAWADDRFLGGYRDALDPETLAGMSPLRSLSDAGAIIALSTDAPVQGFNPFIQIAGAVMHPLPSERLSVYEALRAYAWGGAYAGFEEGERGTLEVGKRADFIVMDDDPFETAHDQLHRLKVRSTWKDGRPLSIPGAGLPALAANALRGLGKGAIL
ncbi:MAG TPA: amidohydrolase family protein [Rectinemataceae bacterium]|nr:amidohydrolase family protein [Rectinemataceae bacterium]